MRHKFLDTHLGITEQNISYYNGIAGQYDCMVNKNSDKAVRQKVADKFSDMVRNTTILDFGGGTGLDLIWLSGNNNKIFFCEPSKAMREIAISNYKKQARAKVIFLDGCAADFRKWHLKLPFDEKVDAVLSNFAVLNCIQDIKLLFQNLALVVKPGGNMIALVLTKSFKKILKGNLRYIFTSFIRHKPVSINVGYKEYQQTVYIYSINEIIKASENYFILCNRERIAGCDFTVIHLKRK